MSKPKQLTTQEFQALLNNAIEHHREASEVLDNTIAVIDEQIRSWHGMDVIDGTIIAEQKQIEEGK